MKIIDEIDETSISLSLFIFITFFLMALIIYVFCIYECNMKIEGSKRKQFFGVTFSD